MSSDSISMSPPAGERRPSLHYAVAHYTLRFMALNDAASYLYTMGTKDSSDLLEAAIEAACKQLNLTADFTAQEMKVHPIRVAGHPCAVVEMPLPPEVADAYFTALIASWPPVPPPEEPAFAPRYFTLEKGSNLDGTPRTVLGEWTKSDHHNYGDGPEPTVAAFARSLDQLIARKS